MSDLRTRILARLDRWDEEHETSGCPVSLPGDCIHSASAAVRAVLAEVALWPAGGRSRATSVEVTIARALGIEEAGDGRS